MEKALPYNLAAVRTVHCGKNMFDNRGILF